MIWVEATSLVWLGVTQLIGQVDCNRSPDNEKINNRGTSVDGTTSDPNTEYENIL
jgi:hypothetical protein